MPAVMIPLIVVHVVAVIAKLSVFFVIPRLANVEAVQGFLARYRPFERTADWILWITGAGLLYFASWQMLRQTWMIVSLALYLLVFVMIRYALMKELEKIANSKKLLAAEELRRLRVNNWCVGIISVVLLGVIASLMMTKP
ncbi:DUF2269 family protein [Alicyclobacillus cycloheptanicus]|uniref:Copper resistance protein D n=1 Tax=Alicyclobacillus cycloheptanicus TaxID=1457 RepID=A0ABT9XI23_9BACL|nr:DUF2269 family protein [Alicyclobacillus cycloheptanicus]MDQ0189970.1 hypothetical protein [Alicyclobacillus cycloheptanicus]WDM00118.1 DUF2269 family protein [Alicyclobacillus cycloheptanicus]